MGPDGTHIGMVTFGDTAEKIFDFKEFDKDTYNEAEVLRKMTSIPKPLSSERTFINRGLRLANLEVIREEFGMRPDVKQVGFPIHFLYDTKHDNIMSSWGQSI